MAMVLLSSLHIEGKHQKMRFRPFLLLPTKIVHRENGERKSQLLTLIAVYVLYYTLQESFFLHTCVQYFLSNKQKDYKNTPNETCKQAHTHSFLFLFYLSATVSDSSPGRTDSSLAHLIHAFVSFSLSQMNFLTTINEP